MKNSILLNMVLVTVLATSTFFISTTASTTEYNPWSDIDGDGEITIYDVVKVTGIYGSSGNPTRNVVEKADYYCLQYTLFPLQYGKNVSYYCSTGGYRYITWAITNEDHKNIWVLSSFSHNIERTRSFVVDEYHIDEYVVGPHKTLQVQGNYFEVNIRNVGPKHEIAYISLSIYATS